MSVEPTEPITAIGPPAASAGDGWPIAGHGAAVATLRRSLSSNHIAHAYLITGPEASGRATLARLFASALVCATGADTGPATVACGICAGCRKVARGVHPDVEVLSLAGQQAAAEARGSRNRNITIESVRGLRERLVLRPLEARWRVAIVEDAETMSGGGGLPAASALLKTLEEPPPFAVLILIAPEAEAVLPTLRSRCQRIALGPVSAADIACYLVERQGVAEAMARDLAALAQGRAGWAVRAATDPALLEARQAGLRRALALLSAGALGRLQGIDDLASRFGKADWREAEADLDLLIGVWRDLLLLTGGAPALALHAPSLPELSALAERLTLAEAAAALAATRAAALHLRQNVSPRLALEAMVLTWPRFDA
ncbi:MAG: DNA polymerase III subunit [Chloroflexi bacterium]|nr:DNA polymerase III subunit [Chloroflexota bacterium]